MLARSQADFASRQTLRAHAREAIQKAVLVTCNTKVHTSSTTAILRSRSASVGRGAQDAPVPFSPGGLPLQFLLR